jgi:predicted Zn-dependent peptidase
MTTTITAIPAVRPSRPWSFPALRRHRLPNGLTVETVDMPGRHVVSVVLVFDLPLHTEPAGLDGAIAAMAYNLNEGISGFPERLGLLGATWMVGSDHAGPRIIIEAPRWQLAEVLALAAEALESPTFPQDALDGYLARAQTQYQRERTAPDTRAVMEFFAAVIQPGCRASRRRDGDERSLPRIRTAHLADLHQTRMSPGRTTLVLVGDFSQTQPLEIASSTLGRWRAPAPAAEPLQDNLARQGPPLVAVERPGMVQTRFLLGCFATDRRDPDWPALSVAGHVLGYGPTSRINASLREKSNYTYGVEVKFLPFQRGGLFMVGGSLHGPATLLALRDLHDILGQVCSDGFTEAECRAASEHIVRAAPMTYESAITVAQQRAELIGAGMPDTYVDAHLDRVRQVTAEEVSSAFARHVDPAALTLVTVGDGALFETRLRASGR